MDILPATLLDLNSLRKIEKICFPKDAWPLLDLIAVLSMTEVIRLKGVAGGQMIAFIAGDPRPAQNTDWIATIAVLPEYQGHGYGRQLLEACEARLTQACIRLCVRISNEAAIRMYKGAGYCAVDTWGQYYKDGENALVMEKIR
ncbi:MAG: GNAT family N-acetyltransferase [Anaerolineales bacterium]|nr:GNAT family N-acetyltransferase [Anaerolineales bacterium]